MKSNTAALPILATLLIAAWGVVGCSHSATVPERDLCTGKLSGGANGFRIRGNISPSLNDTEKRLVCGDAEQSEWRNIPLWQAEYNLKNFLQERGLFHPTFTKNGQVLVDVGVPVRVTKVATRGAPEALILDRKRFVVGEVLTPALLGELEGWVAGQLKSLGYPCPTIKSEADPDTGEILVNVKTGPLQNAVSVLEEQVTGVEPGVLRRFDAFGFGELYNDKLVTLSSLRVTRRGLFDSAYFITSCGPNGAILREQVVVGPPRLLSFKVGADTEGLIQFGASWTNARLGRKGSLLQASVLASTKEQRASTLLEWYVFGGASRQAIRPLFELSHSNEQFFEFTQARTQLGYQQSWEWHPAMGRLLIGPQYAQIQTNRGTGPPDSRFLTMSGEFAITSHDYELYLTQPKSGYLIDVTGDAATRGFGSSVTAQRLGLQVEGLWNYRDYDPPLLIFGMRGFFHTTLSPAQSQQGGDSQLPPNYTYFLGGSRDLRGFSRLSLPGSGVGGLSSAYLGVETRIVRVAPFNLEPFLFTDVGSIGPLPFTLRDPIYYSPGFGLRWSPGFGSFRTTLGRGFPLNAPGGWQFYFSFGEEF